MTFGKAFACLVGLSIVTVSVDRMTGFIVPWRQFAWGSCVHDTLVAVGGAVVALWLWRRR